MKKVIIGVFLVVIIIISIFFVWYNKNIQILRETKKFNSEFEFYLNKDINGVDLTTIINKALENNANYEVEKNSNGTYKNNNKNSIEIIIKPTTNRKFISNGSI